MTEAPRGDQQQRRREQTQLGNSGDPHRFRGELQRDAEAVTAGGTAPARRAFSKSWTRGVYVDDTARFARRHRLRVYCLRNRGTASAPQ